MDWALKTTSVTLFKKKKKHNNIKQTDQQSKMQNKNHLKIKFEHVKGTFSPTSV